MGSDVRPHNGGAPDITVAERELESLLVDQVGAALVTKAAVRRAQMRQRENHPPCLTEPAEELGCLFELAPGKGGVPTGFRNMGRSEDRPGTSRFRDLPANPKRALVPVRGLFDRGSRPPEAPERPREHEPARARAAIPRVV